MIAASGKLDRREMLREVLRQRGPLLVVAGLGAPAWDVTALGDTPLNLPLWGGMGAAAMIGLGLALAQPGRRVLVVTGDGEMLMGIGARATIAVQAPANLAILVQDNERYGETGMQRTATHFGVGLVAMAEGAGLRRTHRITAPEHVAPFRHAIHHADAPVFAVAKVDDAPQPLVLPSREGALLQARMREALLGPEAHLA